MTQDRPSLSSEASWFGNKPVDPEHKASLVRQVFDSVAPKYDLMNDLMSLGIHRLWKSSLIKQIDPRPGQKLLDVAGGTGDIAFSFLDAAQENQNPQHLPAAQAIICDINSSMLSVGQDRAINRGILQNIEWVVGNAESLPLSNSSVDTYTIAFGLRNVTHIDLALKEANRVLKPGGRFFCLEFSRVVLPLLEQVYDYYSFSVLPWLGQLVAQDRDSYVYLAESIRRFPEQEKLAQRMEKAGLSAVRWRNLSGGIAAIHSGWRV